MHPSIDVLFVPRGVEYKAVCQGLRSNLLSKPLVVAVPVGYEPLNQFLNQWLQVNPFGNQPIRGLATGLCGSLAAQHQVGDVVVYSGCIDAHEGINVPWQACDREITLALTQALQPKTGPIQALTSDRVIFAAREKQQLGQQYAAEVVDMEGYAFLQSCRSAQIKIGMLRVVSDDCFHDLPDLSTAFAADGSLRSLPLAIAMLRQPVAALRLIRSSLHSLGILQQTINRLFTSTSISES